MPRQPGPELERVLGLKVGKSTTVRTMGAVNTARAKQPEVKLTCRQCEGGYVVTRLS